jgi:hypothetical protein
VTSVAPTAEVAVGLLVEAGAKVNPDREETDLVDQKAEAAQEEDDLRRDLDQIPHQGKIFSIQYHFYLL